jgi:hypothetical protein
MPSMTRLLTRGPCKAITARRQAFITTASNPLPYSQVIYRAQAVAPKEYTYDAVQVYGSEVKVNPSESEADVAADRGEIDPLPMGLHYTILLDAGEASVYGCPTASEEAVHADRYMEDPLKESHVIIARETDIICIGDGYIVVKQTV